jgi:hypothetical protein
MRTTFKRYTKILNKNKKFQFHIRTPAKIKADFPVHYSSCMHNVPIRKVEIF